MKLIVDYIISLTNLYGIVHKEKVIEIYNKQNKAKVDLLKIDTVIKEKHEALVDGFVEMHENNFVHESIIYFDEFNKEFEEKIGKPFYIPNKEELLKYKDEFYYERTKAFNTLHRFMTEHYTNGNKMEAEELAENIQLAAQSDPTPSNVLNEFEVWGVVFTDEKEVSEVVEMIINLVNNTRLWANNGYTPNELRKLREEESDITSEIVGRNDPCPCGSGKKYKKCCI